MNSFGETIKNLRQEKELPLRKVAAYLDIDQAIVSKFEHGTRMPKREQVIQIARFFDVEEDSLVVKWIAQKLVYEIEDEDLAIEAIQIAKESIKQLKEQNDQFPQTGKMIKKKTVKHKINN